MNIQQVIKYLILLIVLLFLQVIIFQKIYLTPYCVPYFYFMFILMLPVDMNKYLVLMMAFILGLIMDGFYYTGGIHAAASTCAAYLRHYWLNIIEPSERYEEHQLPVKYQMGAEWVLKYIFPLLFIQHLLLFSLEAFRLDILGWVILRTVLSSVVSTAIIFYIQILFFRPKRL